MNFLQRIDRYFYRYLTRGWPNDWVEQYVKGLRIDDEQSEIPTVIGRSFQVIDAKAAALLTHTSMMVAALGVTAAVVAETYSQQAVIVIEIVLYLVISVLCLRCISLFHELPAFDTETLKLAVRDELILRRGLYMLCNRLTIYLTLVVLISLPILFII